MRRLGMLALSLAVACGGSGKDSATAPTAQSKRLEIDNYLVKSVAVNVDGVAIGSAAAGYSGSPSSVVIVIPAGARKLTYTTAHTYTSNGNPLPEDFGSETIDLPNTDAALGINNIIAGTPFFAPSFFNATSSSVDFAISQNGAVTCIVTVLSGGFVPVQFGYYQLTNTTQVRYYPGGSGCKGGAYKYWDYAVLSQYEINSGRISLTGSSYPQ